MNRQIRQLAGALIVLYVVLFAALNYWQVGRTEGLASQRQLHVPDPPVRLAARTVVTADGVVIARSEQVPGATDVKFRRLHCHDRRAVRQRHRRSAWARRSWRRPGPTCSAATRSHSKSRPRRDVQRHERPSPARST